MTKNQKMLDLNLYIRRCKKTPEAGRLGIPVLMLLDALQEGERELLEVVKSLECFKVSTIGTSQINGLAALEFIKTRKIQRKVLAQGCNEVRHVKLTGKGKRFIAGVVLG